MTPRANSPTVTVSIATHVPVRFVKSSVGLAAWNALGTRAFGEVISADSL